MKTDPARLIKDITKLEHETDFWQSKRSEILQIEKVNSQTQSKNRIYFLVCKFMLILCFEKNMNDDLLYTLVAGRIPDRIIRILNQCVYNNNESSNDLRTRRASKG